jgi:AcrR family transcriptional regulator
MATKDNRRTKITKMLLKNALIELMYEKQVTQITIKELCDRADLNRTTFYTHYSNLEELLHDIEQELIENTLYRLTGLEPGQDYTVYVEKSLEYMKEEKDLFKLLLCVQREEKFYTLFVNNIGMFVDKKTSKVNLYSRESYVRAFMIHGFINMIIQWLNDDCALGIHELAQLGSKIGVSIGKMTKMNMDLLKGENANE